MLNYCGKKKAKKKRKIFAYAQKIYYYQELFVKKIFNTDLLYFLFSKNTNELKKKIFLRPKRTYTKKKKFSNRIWTKKKNKLIKK